MVGRAWFGRGGIRTASMAFLTRSDVIMPLLVRFLIRAGFVEPVDIHAMVSESVGLLGMCLEAR